MRGPAKRCEDILSAIEVVRRFAGRGFEAFHDDVETQSVILRHLQIVGEAAWRIPEDVRRLAQQIPWDSIAGLRHIIVHDYFEVNHDLIWRVVEHDLEALEREIKTLRERLTDPERG